MRAMCLSLALLTAAVSPVAAETPLDAVLYLVSTLDAQDTGERKVTVTQDTASLDAKVFMSTGPGIPGGLKHTFSVSVRRLADCRFDVGFAVATAIDKVDHHGLDLSAANLAGTYFKDAPNNLDVHALVIPGAIWCHIGILHSRLGDPSCRHATEVLPFFGPSHDGKMLAAVRRLEKLCAAKVSRL
jgi:hypothetical protein